MEWKSVTVKGNQYIKIESVTVTIPLLGSSEEIKFKSKDAELIHIAINGSAISSDWEFSKWVEQLRKVLLQKKMPATVVSQHTKFFVVVTTTDSLFYFFVVVLQFHLFQVSH